MSRPARPQAGGNGAGQNFNSTLSIVVAVVAVLVGFFILRDINSNGTSSSSSPSDDTSVDAGTTVPDAAVTTLPAATNTTGFKVLVANASGVPGSAGDVSVALQGLGFIVQPPLNKSDATPKQTLTMVYYIAGQEANAA
ncbi:MAG: LytR C-terminal domain-containing protein, partial [Actinomycetes bacterium]